MKLQDLARLLSAVVALSLFSIAVAQSAADNPELQLGVEAYKQARYDEAIQHFEKAVLKDPGAVNPHLYLATVYVQEYIPGVETAENLQLGARSLEQYKKVLEIDSSHLNATKGIAYLDLQMKKFDESRDYYRRATELDPKDAEAYYCVGVVDWTQTYQPRMELRAKLGLKPEQSIIKRAECWQVRDANLDRVSDGIEMLQKAIELRPDYDDAMAYLNLMYRERADIQCYDAKANAADLDTADQWVDKTMAVKKAKAQKDKAQPSADANQQ